MWLVAGSVFEEYHGPAASVAGWPYWTYQTITSMWQSEGDGPLDGFVDSVAGLPDAEDVLDVENVTSMLQRAA